MFGAAEGPTIDLTPEPGREYRREPSNRSAFAGSTAVRDLTILAGFADAKTGKVVADVVEADGLDVVACGDKQSIIEEIERRHPALMVLEDVPSIDAQGIAQSVRGRGDDWSSEVPIIAVSKQQNAPKDAQAYITDWLTHPFSSEYARTRMRAWLMRTVPRWNRAVLPDNEAARIDSLHSLNVLDTPREERFDRITRLASVALDVPIAVISLVDRERQWLKSCVGLDATETPRDAAFCAHAILKPEVMVVPDTLLDDRFAENPLVTGGPRIRFYAGCPLTLDDGAVIGTLCCIDTRPRQPNERQLGALRDLARLVERELAV